MYYCPRVPDRPFRAENEAGQVSATCRFVIGMKETVGGVGGEVRESLITSSLPKLRSASVVCRAQIGYVQLADFVRCLPWVDTALTGGCGECGEF